MAGRGTLHVVRGDVNDGGEILFETDVELAQLQALLDRSMADAKPHLTSIVSSDRRLNARQVCTYMQNVKHITLATVTKAGEPFIGPLDGWFLHGQFVASTAGNSLRVRHLRRNAAVSVCHLDGDNISIWAHGKAVILDRDDPLARAYDGIATATYGSSPYTFGEDIVVMRIEPRVLFAYAFVPSKYPEEMPAEAD